MKWSFKLTRLWGIDVYIHYTFLLLLGFVGLQSGLERGNWSAALGGMAFFLSLFLCVLLHEYGHAMAARRYGIGTHDITLLPIGGVARLERMPENPAHELVIAIAGPLVNVVIAGGLALGMVISGTAWGSLRDLESVSYFQRLIVINLSLVVFNLLPAFPMDGGRVLRAVLAMSLDPLRATRIAANIGRTMAVLFVALAFYTRSPILGLIAVFVWLGAGAEAAATEARSFIGDARVFRAMLTHFQVLSPTDPLARAAQLIISGSQTDFPVVASDGRVVGVLSRSALFAGLTREGESAPVERVMETNFLTLDADQSLEAALALLSESPAPLAAVASQGRIVGILTLENASEFIALQRARRSRMPQEPVSPPVIVAVPPQLPR